MNTDSKLDWQPARIRLGQHPMLPNNYWAASPEERKEMQSRMVHIRESVGNSYAESLYRERGCTATRFFIIKEYPRRIVCEHEILTD